ncbi:hypothetical protein D9613_009583 [Agrocybe pediades]|uniref:DUF300-domain-containing protein n=1 Tax=Agrocybe pediades TaxID=84607 RepID=A0A8H4R2A0_9AGAR|nr:hypothetical protein D9613_009583 [Agrocybe pediades]
MPCPTSPNQIAINQSKFWDANGIHWSTHRIGWAIAGGCTVVTIVISIVSILQHYRNYTNPAQQRQILRILYMPPVYAIISFFSYRFYRDYTYYSFIQIAYEAVTLSAFLLLIIEYVASTATGHSAEKALERKDKSPLPMPFCCWRYRPTKAYFMYTVKWSVLQYVIIRPAASIAGIICEKLDILCEADGYSLKYASIYIDGLDFISISIALYGLFVFYGLTKEELADKRPLAKFLSIKLIVMFTFYQTFVIKALHSKIHATAYWTTTNIANGLNALCICVEMIFFSALMWWAYTAKEYERAPGSPPTSIRKPLWDSINFSDFAREIINSMRFYANTVRGKPTGHIYGQESVGDRRSVTFGEAFGVSNYQPLPTPSPSTYNVNRIPDRDPYAQHPSYNYTSRPSVSEQGAGASTEHIMLQPYPFSPERQR